MKLRIILIQLKLLCWKNLTLQRRQKKRLVTEIVWPLTLFLILMWVRTRELKLFYKECHFEAKAMPSVGIMSMIQTYMCTMNNTCYEQHIENVDQAIVSYNNSILTELFVDLTQFTQEHLYPSNKQLLETVLKNVMILGFQNSTSASNQSIQNNLFENLISLSNQENIFQQLFETNNPFELALKIMQFQRLSSAAAEFIQKHQNKIVETSTSNYSTTQIINRLICGRDKSNFLGGINFTDSNTTILKYTDRFKKIKPAPLLTPVNENKKTKSACPDFVYALFGEDTLVQDFWKIIKPVIEGKILFYPDTPVTRKLMDRVDRVFDGFAISHMLTEFWLNDLSPNLKQNLNNTNSTLLSLLHILNITTMNSSEILPLLTNVDSTVQIINNFFNCFEFEKVQPVKSEADLTEMSSKLNKGNNLWAVVEFDDKSKYENDKLPKYVKYKIRMDASRTAPTKILRNPPMPNPQRLPLLNLQNLYFGFAFLQDMIEKAIINEQINKTVFTGIWVQQFPYPCYINDRFIIAVAGSFPMFMILSWVYTTAMLVRSIVYEKERRLKEVMKTMGLSNLVHWLCWFINSFVVIIITIIILILILKFGSILTYSDASIIFLFLLCFGIATIALSFLLSTFFNQANMAAAVAGLVYFILYLPYAFLIRWEDHLTYSFRKGASILSNVALGYGCSYIAQMERLGIGLNWNNFAGTDEIPESDYTILDSIEMLLLDSILYFIIALYIEAVFPGTYGLPLPWYCCLLPCIRCCKKKTHAEDSENTDPPAENLNFEAEPTNLNLGIAVKNLRKVYKDGKVAVDNLTLNFYEDQITAFLGQNGAGKTTTISILVGLFPPTSGTAIINGKDIRTSMSDIHRSLGMCPQFNVLFDELTVYEHLWFYANLKRIDKPISVNEEIDQMITDIGLDDKRNVLSKKLSGGMLRKLSIGVAFIGDSKVVILDEPTAGVDPQSRRSIWDLLVKYKKGRTILLTTHFMDEADILGDRIAIVHKGKIHCCGSSLFLKKRFGKGYYITAIKKNSDDTTVSRKMITFIKLFIPNAHLKEDIGFELTFILPFDNLENFKPLLDGLERNKARLGITEFGISDAKLEEIFLKVVSSEETVTGDDSNVTIDASKFDVPKFVKVTGWALVKQQIRALSVKKFYHTIRNPKSIFAEIVLPAIFIFIAFMLIEIIPPILSLPALELTTYRNPKNHYIFFSEFFDKSNETQSQIDSLVNEPYLGTRCVTGEPLGLECKKLNADSSKLNATGSVKSNAPCSCNKGVMSCPEGVLDYNIPSILIDTDDELANVTGQNLTDWLIKTHSKYQFYRHGGYTIGHSIAPETGIYWCDWLDLLQIVGLNTSSYPDCRSSERLGTIKVWFNNKDSQSVLAYMNAINNVILRAALSDREDFKSYGISVTNHPLSFSAEQLLKSIQSYGFFTVLQSVSIVFAMSFVPASFVLFLINERISKFKHLQFISGVKPIAYWSINFFLDFLMYLTTVALCIIIFLSFDDTGYTSEKNFLPVCLLLICYGLATIPLMYPFSFVFSIPSMAFVALSCCNLFLGIASTLSTFILQLFADEDEELRTYYEILRQVFLILPQYCLGRGLIELKSHQQTADALEEFGFISIAEPLDWDFVGRNIVFMLIICVISFVVTIMIEYRAFYRPLSHVKDSDLVALRINEDEDVAAERDKVHSGEYDDAVLKVQSLQKVYDSRPFYVMLKDFFKTKICRRPGKFDNRTLQAVDRLSFGVNKGECFGLLGANGAGKTTTFKMLTGDVQCSSGNAYLMGYSIRTNMLQVRQNLGYCPQFDALDEFLTCEEHLKLFAELKGIHPNEHDTAVNWTVAKLNLKSHFHKRAGKYSGGNKRKLCTGIAMIGSPPAIYLDEPTTGMDPKSKRFLWDCILSLVKSGQSIVLTTHSLEECEALCTRLAIMVAGRFRCFGTVQHLKNRLGGGYFLIIRVIDPSMMDNVFKYIDEEFPLAAMQEYHNNYAQFSFPQNDVILSDLFEKMETNKVELGIADYSISQTTLDKVFLSFATTDI